MVLERFSEDAGLVVELARAGLHAAATAAVAAAVAPDGGGGGAEGHEAAGAAAEELVLELVGDDRLLEAVCEPASQGSASAGTSPRHQLVALLWRHARSRLGAGRDFAAAQAFFAAVLPLLERGSDSAGCTQETAEPGGVAPLPTPAACHRSMALCRMAAGDHTGCAALPSRVCFPSVCKAGSSQRAAPITRCRVLAALEAADTLEPASLPTAMLRLAAHLAAGDAAAAADAVAALAACPGADGDALRIACCQCADAGAPAAARRALECLLARCAAAGSDAGGGLDAPGAEAVLFQNLVKLLLVGRLPVVGVMVG